MANEKGTRKQREKVNKQGTLGQAVIHLVFGAQGSKKHKKHTPLCVLMWKHCVHTHVLRYVIHREARAP